MCRAMRCVGLGGSNSRGGHGGIWRPGHGGHRAPDPTDGVASIQPPNGAVVGVAHPVIVTFTGPVIDRRGRRAGDQDHPPPNHIDRAIRLGRAPTSCSGRRTRTGLRTATSAFRCTRLSTGFDTGDEVLGVASISAHTFTVSINGEVLRTMPASMGKPTRPTPMGNFTALSKERTVVMDSRTIGIPLELVGGVQDHRVSTPYA